MYTKTILWLGLFLVAMCFASASSYNNFQECRVDYSDKCLTFDISAEENTFDLSYRFVRSEYQKSIDGTYILSNMNRDDYYYYDRSGSCKQILYSKNNEPPIANGEFTIREDDIIHIKGVGCNIQENNWYTQNFQMQIRYYQENSNNYNRNNDYRTDYNRIEITKFVKSADYEKQQMMNKYVYRWIPVIIIIILSILGLKRVRR